MIFRRFQKSAAEPDVELPSTVNPIGPKPPKGLPLKPEYVGKPTRLLGGTFDPYPPVYRDLSKARQKVRDLAGSRWYESVVPGAKSLRQRRLADARRALAKLHGENRSNVVQTKRNLASQIARWYSTTPGGLDRAVADAQKAMQNRDPRLAQHFSAWDPGNVYKDIPVDVAAAGRFPVFETENVTYNRPFSVTPRGTQTTVLLSGYDPTTRKAYVPDPETLAGQAKMERALSTAVFGQGGQDLGSPSDVSAEASLPYNADTLLSEIKRRYSYFTGRPVNNLAEARRAWNWWGRNRSAGDQLGPRDIEEPRFVTGKENLPFPVLYEDRNRIDAEVQPMPLKSMQTHPRDWPTAPTGRFWEYNAMPNDTKELLLKRMLELVRNSGRTAAPVA